MKKSVAAFILSAVAMAKSHRLPVISIPSCAVTSPLEHETWSKRDMQRMKGKAARKNRGKNRSKYNV